MSVMPVPKFQTLYCSVGRVTKFSEELPRIEDFGRLHFTSTEVKDYYKEQRKRIRDMGFGIVNASELPVVQIGKTAPTKPVITVADNGRLIFNSFMVKEFIEKGYQKLGVIADRDARKFALIPLPVGAEVKLKGYDQATNRDINFGTGKASASIGFQGYLKAIIPYDYKAAGSHPYEVEWAEKLKAYVFTLPKETPTPRPRVTRTKSAATAPVAGSMLAAALTPPAVVVEDDELVMD